MYVTDDRVAELTTVTGTGAAALSGAIAGCKAFAAAKRPDGTAIQDGDVVPYYIEAVDASKVPTGAFEDGFGTYTAAAGITRTTVLRSSNADAVVSFAAGDKVISIGLLSSQIVQLNNEKAVPLPAVPAEPAVPAANTLLIYAKSLAGRMLPKVMGPSGIDTALQVGLHGNSVFMVAPASGTTAPTAWGGTLTTAATMSVQQTIASANPWLATWRKRFQTSTTAGNASGMRTAYVQWFRGNAAGFGGFFFRAQIGANINLNGGQKFVGLCASTGALAGEPSALLNMIGMGWDAADSSAGNWQLMRNDGAGAATKVDLGANALRSNTTHGYDLIIYCPPGAATTIYVRIVNIHTGTTVLDTSYTTDLPAVNTGMAFKAEVRNGAVAAADNLEVAKVYIESDY